jgi:hypothetical protein
VATGDQISFLYSGAASLGAAQTDPNASLGGWQSSTNPYHTEGSLTSAMTLANEFVDTAQIGNLDVAVGDWILFVTGTNALEARKVTAFTSGTGFFRLRDPLPNLGAIGNVYRVHGPNNLFDDVPSSESEVGRVEYRGVFAQQNSGVTLNDPAFYFSLVEGGTSSPEIAADDGHLTQFPETLSSETDEPDLSLLGTNIRFERPLNYASAFPAAPATGFWLNTQNRALWLRRTVFANAREEGESVWAVIVETSDTGGDPSPLRSGFLIVFDLDGYPEEIEIEIDRNVYVGGGGRVKATVLTSTGVPVENEYVGFSIETGPGTLYDDAGNDVTDENGEVAVTYHGPASDVVRTDGAPKLSFALVDGGDDTIDRDDGSFVTDGFTNGMYIAIHDSFSNDGFETIKATAALQLTFDGDVLVNEDDTLFADLSEAARIKVKVI